MWRKRYDVDCRYNLCFDWAQMFLRIGVIDENEKRRKELYKKELRLTKVRSSTTGRNIKTRATL